MTRADLARRLASLRGSYKARELPGWEYKLLRKGATIAYALENPTRRAARRRVQSALASGKLERPRECEACGGAAPLNGHHGDYEQPLRVRFLCEDCHYCADLAMAGRHPCRRGSTMLTSSWWTSRVVEGVRA